MNTPHCDICNRSIEELARSDQGDDTPPIQIDADGLWICEECRAQIKTTPAKFESDELDERLKPLIGQSAGAICYTLDLPSVPPYKAIIEAAALIAYDQNLFMSTWQFITQWQDGSTLWRSPDGNATIVVTPDGEIQTIK
jgi:hypothetical protein